MPHSCHWLQHRGNNKYVANSYELSSVPQTLVTCKKCKANEFLSSLVFFGSLMLWLIGVYFTDNYIETSTINKVSFLVFILSNFTIITNSILLWRLTFSFSKTSAQICFHIYKVQSAKLVTFCAPLNPINPKNIQWCSF